ncbi:MAG: hypothetical protein BMS9Abin01_1079 [Gammaproteobacteria bacterium]|nr:MAG: hypothetical protein BMS9Abin01_1079 [Gammaproteobacteria bacterium]
MATFTHISDRRLAIDELDKSIVNLSARINASPGVVEAVNRAHERRALWARDGGCAGRGHGGRFRGSA